jgi:hypothetical protein
MEYSSTDLQIFLRDFEKNTEVELIEESKQINELFAVAKAKGILAMGSRDLAVFKGVYSIADIPNGNGMIIPENDLLRMLPTIIGKPITVDHVRRYVIGYIIDYRYLAKEKQAIIYFVIFKNCFQEEFEKMVRFFKEKKLKLSSEVWSPKDKREYVSKNEYKIKVAELAGCTIVFEEGQDHPALEDATVLEYAKLHYGEQEEMVFSTLKKDGLQVMTCGKCKEKGCGLCENLLTSMQEVVAPAVASAPATPVPVAQPLQPNKVKIICQHCGHNFEYLFVPGQNNPINCTNCTAIVDQQGKVIYPPQIKNFSLSCSNCQSRDNWLTLSAKDNEALVRCNSCKKEYDLKFKQVPEEYMKLLGKIMFLRTGTASCNQCGTSNEFAIPSSEKEVMIKCKKCGLPYPFSIEKAMKRDIESFAEHKEQMKHEEDKKMYILEESKLEIQEDYLNEADKDELGDVLVESKKLSYEEKQGIEDKNFAVVITVKNKTTGEPRKIRKYPIEDEAHVRNALARLGQEAPREELKKLGVNPDDVVKKVLAKAKELGMNEIMKAHGMEKSKCNKLMRKAVEKIKSSKMEAKKKEEELELCKSKLAKFVKGIKKFHGVVNQLKDKTAGTEMELSKSKLEVENTKKLYSRKQELGELAKGVPDEKIIDDKEYELIVSKRTREPELPIASTTNVRSTVKDDDYYKQQRAEIDEKAFGHNKK